MIQPDDLSLVLIAGSSPEPESLSVYHEIYRCWRTVWTETFRVLKGTEVVFSDDFTRQDHILAVMHGSRCVALGMIRRVDFRSTATPHDSYFSVWSDEAIRGLISDGPNVLVGSNLTVDAEYRGDLQNGLYLKNVVCALVARYLVDSDADVMCASMRCDRGAQKAAYRSGAQPIQTGVLLHGVNVDLVGFYRRSISFDNSDTQALADRLWRTKSDLWIATDRSTAGTGR